jgi:hypothetical protein
VRVDGLDFTAQELRALRALRTPHGIQRALDAMPYHHRSLRELVLTTDGPLWWIAEHLAEVRHTPLLSAAMVRRLHRVDRRSLDAGLVGYDAG